MHLYVTRFTKAVDQGQAVDVFSKPLSSVWTVGYHFHENPQYFCATQYSEITRNYRFLTLVTILLNVTISYIF
jgi:hypothetical protein